MQFYQHDIRKSTQNLCFFFFFCVSYMHTRHTLVDPLNNTPFTIGLLKDDANLVYKAASIKC